MEHASHIDDRIARHNVAVLTLSNAVLGTQMPMIFTLGGLAGAMLAPNPCLATLGISLIVFGSMTTSPWLSMVMQRYGRATGLAIGAMGGLAGALVAALGIYAGSFAVFLLGCYFSGIYQSSQAFMRFAGIDAASESFRPKAVSYILAGGLVAAIVGPQLVKLTYEAFGTVFVGTYLAAAAVNAVGVWIYLFLKPSGLARTVDGAGAKSRTRLELLRSPDVLVAMVCAMVAYSLMTLMMTSAPLAIVGCGFAPTHAADVVSAHVLAMFAPSFVTGHLVARFGTRTMVLIGLMILTGAGTVALSGVELVNFFGALILLGIGWNFAFIGATTMLAESHAPHERGRVQGLNDLMVFGSVTIASLASGGLLNCSGGSPAEGWNAVALTMLPFLVLAGAGLLWLSRRQADPQPD